MVDITELARHHKPRYLTKWQKLKIKIVNILNRITCYNRHKQGKRHMLYEIVVTGDYLVRLGNKVTNR